MQHSNAYLSFYSPKSQLSFENRLTFDEKDLEMLNNFSYYERSKDNGSEESSGI